MYWLALAVHVLSALFWLGGMLFLGIVGAPVLRQVEPPALRQQLFHQLGLRFRSAGWVAIALLLASGTGLLHFRGLLSTRVLGDPDFWSTGTGTALGIKLGAVAVMLLLSALHDFVLGPRAGRHPAGSPAALRLRRQAAHLARLNAIVAIVLVLAAIRLAR